MTARWVVRRAPNGEWWWAFSPQGMCWGFPDHAAAVKFAHKIARLAR